MITEMKKMGFSKIIATPHTYPGLYNNTNDSILRSYNKLKEKLKSTLEISYASEYMLNMKLIDGAKKKKLLCLKDRFLLVELSYIGAPLNLYEILFEINVNGYIPVLAHPERYTFLHNKFDEYYKLKKVGCLFQINLLSATDYYGKNVKKNLNFLIGNKLIDFAGSDIHGNRHINAFERKVKIDDLTLFQKIMEQNNKFK